MFFMYGQNYIYEPVYYSTPVIYASFTKLPSLLSNLELGYYPSYYYAWNPFQFSDIETTSIYAWILTTIILINYRRSERAVVLYSSRRSNGYERQNPNYSFLKKYNVTNRYELDQRRGSRNEIVNSNGRTNPKRLYSKQNKFFREAAPQRGNSKEITLQTGPLLQEKQHKEETLTEIILRPLLQEKQLHKEKL
jgi:hypothetical protein